MIWEGFDMEKNGFTLVEVAIAIMIIGLLTGGVLTGKSLIDGAKVTRAVAELKSIETSPRIFKSIYNSLPGDMNDASTKLPGCTSPPCSTNGNGNGIIGPTDWITGQNSALAANSETFTLWHHLAAA
jgi:prepilin-type N-terminal cleavage/methylation domain-containing protein